MRNKLNKKALVILVITCISLIHLSSVSSQGKIYQDVAALRYCLYSINDPNFGDWNEATHKGVFMTVINNNTKIGANEAPDYLFITNQPSRGFYDALGGYNSTGSWPYNQISYVPMIQVVEGESNTIYTKCNITMDFGSNLINGIYLDTVANAYDGLRLTADFNLSQEGSINHVNQSDSKYVPVTDYVNYNKTNSPIFWMKNLIMGNNLIQMMYYEFSSGLNGTSFDSLGAESITGKNELLILQNASIDKYISGLYGFRAHNQYISWGNDLFPWFFRRFYINSSYPISNFLHFPKLNITMLPRFEINYSNGTSVVNFGMCNPPSQTNCNLYSPNVSANATFYYYNPYSYEIKNITICPRVTSWPWPNSANPALYLEVFSQFTYASWNPENCPYFDSFAPYETKPLSINFTIPDKKLAYPSVYIQFGILDSPTASDYFKIGGDGENYLYFDNYYASINYSISLGKLVFSLKTRLFSGTEINPDDYNLSVIVYRNDSGFINVVKKIDISLNTSEFARMGVSKIFNSGANYSVDIPINEIYEPGTYNLILEATPISSGARLVGIPTAITNPLKILPGKKFTTGSEVLNFYINAKEIQRSIVISNPTFDTRTFNLSVTAFTDSTNYTFDESILGDITLSPLSFVTKDLNVYANYNPWPSSQIENNFSLLLKDITPFSTALGDESINYTFVALVSSGINCTGSPVTSCDANRLNDCSFYTNSCSNACTDAPCGFGDPALKGTGIAVTSCVWDDITKVCSPAFYDTSSLCTFRFDIADTCIDGKYAINFINTTSGCYREPSSILCRSLVQLPFFSRINMLITLFAMAIIYYISVKNRILLKK